MEKCLDCKDETLIVVDESEEREYYVCPKCNPDHLLNSERKGLYGKCRDCGTSVVLGVDKDYVCGKCNCFLCQSCYTHIKPDDDDDDDDGSDDLDYDSHLYCKECAAEEENKAKRPKLGRHESDFEFECWDCKSKSCTRIEKLERVYISCNACNPDKKLDNDQDGLFFQCNTCHTVLCLISDHDYNCNSCDCFLCLSCCEFEGDRVFCKNCLDFQSQNKSN